MIDKRKLADIILSGDFPEDALLAAVRALKIDGNDVSAEECGDEEKRLTDEFTELVDGLSEREGRISFPFDDFCKMNFRRSFRAKSFSRFGAFSK